MSRHRRQQRRRARMHRETVLHEIAKRSCAARQAHRARGSRMSENVKGRGSVTALHKLMLLIVLCAVCACNVYGPELLTCPELTTWVPDFSAEPCGYTTETFRALKDTCTPVAVQKYDCTTDARYMCANGVEVIQTIDLDAAHASAMITRPMPDGTVCTAYVEGPMQ